MCERPGLVTVKVWVKEAQSSVRPGAAPTWRWRRGPAVVLAVVAMPGLAFVAAGVSVVGLGPAVLVGVYSVAAYRPPARSGPVIAGATLAMLVAVAGSGAGPDTMLADAIVFGVA